MENFVLLVKIHAVDIQEHKELFRVIVYQLYFCSLYIECCMGHIQFYWHKHNKALDATFTHKLLYSSTNFGVVVEQKEKGSFRNRINEGLIVPPQ